MTAAASSGEGTQRPGGVIPRALRGWATHVRAEDFRTAAEVMELAAVYIEELESRPAPSTPTPEPGPALDPELLTEHLRARMLSFTERNDTVELWADGYTTALANLVADLTDPNSQIRQVTGANR